MASLSIQDIQTTQDTPNPARRPREMYAPCRARRKKTAISRNRTGCYTCRRRHLKVRKDSTVERMKDATRDVCVLTTPRSAMKQSRRVGTA